MASSNFWTEHNFSPRWTTPHQPHHSHNQNSHGLAAADEHSQHSHRLSLDTLSRVLHAFPIQHHEAAGPSSAAPAVTKANPRFDLIESSATYRIYGEVPGLTSADLHVDVNDHLFTVTISGELRAPGELAAAVPTQQSDIPVTHRDAVTAGEAEKAHGEEKQEAVAAAPSGQQQQQPMTEGGRGAKEDAAGATTSKHEQDPKIMYHIHERSIGQFKREFQFPVETAIMADVKAQCRNGLLCITVPKHAKPPAERKSGRKLDVE